MKKTAYTLILFLAGLIACLTIIICLDDYIEARSVILRPGVNLKNNVTIRSGSIDQRNGSAGSTVSDYEFYTKENGGVDDYNDGQDIPADSFSENWTNCTADNNYCGTNDVNAIYRDDHTNLVWSDYLDSGEEHTWFWVNNCYEPETAENPGTCSADGDDACQCVKKTSSKTGCEALGDGNWRVPTQKELMQAYIDGSWGIRSDFLDAGNLFWSATTKSNDTHGAWGVALNYGYTPYNAKTTEYDSRCVR